MSGAIQLVVGLGNPGERYTGTRHNAGFWWVDELARRNGGEFRPNTRFHGEVAEIRAPGFNLRLLKPTTFMNRSGRAVQALANFYRIAVSDILVVHDEIDLPPGVVRLKRGGGDGGHRGLRDIIPSVGKDFYRLRVGVGRPEHSSQVIDFVLKKPLAGEQGPIDDAIDRSLRLADTIFRGEMQVAMNELHRKDSSAA